MAWSEDIRASAYGLFGDRKLRDRSEGWKRWWFQSWENIMDNSTKLIEYPCGNGSGRSKSKSSSWKPCAMRSNQRSSHLPSPRVCLLCSPIYKRSRSYSQRSQNSLNNMIFFPRFYLTFSQERKVQGSKQIKKLRSENISHFSYF